MHFSKHYTLSEARLLLPQIRQWLDELDACRARVKTLEEPVAAIVARGDDAGGPAVNQLMKALARCQEIFQKFRRSQIQVKDLERGLIDFPSLREGREVFLCWERDEDDIEFWHDLETGYAGRERL